MATITSPSRMPFGVLDEGRLRNLTNMKNKQNAILPTASALGKRQFEPESDPSFDAENLDPSLFSKKAKSGSGEMIKPSNFVLKPTALGPILTPTTRQTITPKRLAKRPIEVKPVSFSAPPATTAPAGRSPTRKRVGILSKRRTSGASFTRVDPPAFGLRKNTSNGLPFSIDSALSGMVPGRASKPSKGSNVVDTIMTLEDNMPSSWVFDIHEDTPDEELGNLMQHSTETLDISDDEDRKARLMTEVGKENIAPPEYTGRQRAISRQDVMSDEPRTPLGDLKPSEFYADGCDANSYFIIDGVAGEKCSNKVDTVIKLDTLRSSGTPTPSPTEAPSANQDEWRELLASVEAQNAAKIDQGEVVEPSVELSTEVEPPKIDIWESESAHGDEPQQFDPVTTTTSLEESLAVASAHEEAAIEAAS